MITFGQGDITVTMSPERPRPGDKPVAVKAYGRFARAKERMVQEICDAIGGDAVYFEILQQLPGEPDRRHVIPVVAWKRARFGGNGDNSGGLTYVAETLQTADGAGCGIVAYGSARKRWTLKFATSRLSATRDALDAEPDSAGSPVIAVPGMAAGGGMREEF